MKIIDWFLILPFLFFLLLAYHSWKDIRCLYIETQDLIILGAYTLINTIILVINQEYEILYSNFLGSIVCLVIFLVVWFFTKKKGIGEGELFYVPLAYFNIGLINAIEALYICFFSAMLFALVGLISKKLKKTQALPFIPFISFGLIISLFYP